MKKTIRRLIPTILAGAITIGMSFALTGCNKQLIDLNLKFKRVHIFDTGKCYEISSWTDYEDSDQIQVKLKTGETILLSAGVRFALVDKDVCPFEHRS
jgi:hypothetical protein